jgi:BlaI family transcriptional regulator, penicillinase repressor
VYLPTADVEQVRQHALSDVVETFFNGSMEAAVAALLGQAAAPPSSSELDRLAQMIEDARREGGES